jgi:hypothetical protein
VCLVIEFGGHLSKVVDRSAVWFRAKICYPAADFAPPAIAVVEPAKDYFLLMAALAGEFKKELVELADRHDDFSDYGRIPQVYIAGA